MILELLLETMILIFCRRPCDKEHSVGEFNVKQRCRCLFIYLFINYLFILFRRKYDRTFSWRKYNIEYFMKENKTTL